MAAKTMDVVTAIQNFRYFAGWADKNHGQTIEVRRLRCMRAVFEFTLLSSDR